MLVKKTRLEGARESELQILALLRKAIRREDPHIGISFTDPELSPMMALYLVLICASRNISRAAWVATLSDQDGHTAWAPDTMASARPPPHPPGTTRVVDDATQEATRYARHFPIFTPNRRIPDAIPPFFFTSAEGGGR